jgi:hypothetical protein
MDAEAYRNKTVPSAGSLYEEAQALTFAGVDTIGNTLMIGTHYLLQQPDTMQKLKTELLETWPSLNDNEPKLRGLETLPYLNAVIKESLRMSLGVASGLLRVVPPGGATITGVTVPPGVRLLFQKRLRFTDSYRRSYRAVAHSSTSTPTSSPSQRNFFPSAGSSRLSWTAGSLPSPAVPVCVQE